MNVTTKYWDNVDVGNCGVNIYVCISGLTDTYHSFIYVKC